MRLISTILLWLALLTGAAFAQNATKVTILGANGGAATVTGGALNVNATVTPGGTQDVNVTKWGGTSTTLGQKTGSASVPTVLASDQTTTQTFNSQNFLSVTTPDELSVCLNSGPVSGPCTATSAITLFTADMSGYESISVQVTSAGVASTIAYETSDDNTNWLPAFGQASNVSPSITVALSNSTTASLITWPKRGRYFRARVSSYGSGTVTVVGNLHKNPQPLSNRITVDGPSSSGSLVTSGFPAMVRAQSNVATATTGNPGYWTSTLALAGIVKPYSIPEAEWSYAAASGGITNTTTAVTMVAAGGGSVKNYVTSCQISSDALGAATELVIRNGAAGTVLWRTKIGTAGLTGGENINFSDPLPSSANTLLEAATLTATITGGVYINCQGYAAAD